MLARKMKPKTPILNRKVRVSFPFSFLCLLELLTSGDKWLRVVAPSSGFPLESWVRWISKCRQPIIYVFIYWIIAYTAVEGVFNVRTHIGFVSILPFPPTLPRLRSVSELLSVVVLSQRWDVLYVLDVTDLPFRYPVYVIWDSSILSWWKDRLLSFVTAAA